MQSFFADLKNNFAVMVNPLDFVNSKNFRLFSFVVVNRPNVFAAIVHKQNGINEGTERGAAQFGIPNPQIFNGVFAASVADTYDCGAAP